MFGDEPLSDSTVYMELEQAVFDLSSRGMHQAARWASEQLSGLDPAILQHAIAAAAAGTARPLQLDPQDRHPQYMLARQQFEFKEYRRAAFVLAGVEGPKALFLRCYALYLAGEKRREEERAERGGGGDVPGSKGSSQLGAGGLELGSGPASKAVQNQELDSIEAELRAAVAAGAADPFCAYLLGVVLLDKQRTEEAREMLLMSLRSYPCNWSAWMALQRLVSDAATLRALPNAGGSQQQGQGMPHHWSADFFLASACLELQENMEALSKLQRLSHVFPQSQAVEALVAQAHYNLQNFDDAQALYEDLMARDPYRLEGLDVYSNILFVKEAAAPLSALAHRVVSTDKYRAETCAVVGNYYSLKGTHDKAVQYFKRALRLNRGYLAAWTLLGHEYMEAKNTPAAIEAYRAAVDLSAHDFRAWYGLGQAYELLKMPYYALYYYRRAASLRPHDARMWCALGQCYMSEQVGAHEMAIRCYQRAIEHHDPDGIALHMLAKLYEVRHEYEAAEQLYRANLARLEREAAGGEGATAGISTAVALASDPSGAGIRGGAGIEGDNAAGMAAGGGGGGGGLLVMGADAVEALLFLAVRCKDTDRLDEASAICGRLLDLVGGAPKERAKALAREVAALQQQQQQQQQQQLLCSYQQPGLGGGTATGNTGAAVAAVAAMMQGRGAPSPAQPHTTPLPPGADISGIRGPPHNRLHASLIDAAASAITDGNSSSALDQGVSPQGFSVDPGARPAYRGGYGLSGQGPTPGSSSYGWKEGQGGVGGSTGFAGRIARVEARHDGRSAMSDWLQGGGSTPEVPQPVQSSTTPPAHAGAAAAGEAAGSPMSTPTPGSRVGTRPGFLPAGTPPGQPALDAGAAAAPDADAAHAASPHQFGRDNEGGCGSGSGVQGEGVCIPDQGRTPEQWWRQQQHQQQQQQLVQGAGSSGAWAPGPEHTPQGRFEHQLGLAPHTGGSGGSAMQECTYDDGDVGVAVQGAAVQEGNGV